MLLYCSSFQSEIMDLETTTCIYKHYEISLAVCNRAYVGVPGIGLPLSVVIAKWESNARTSL